MQYLYTIEELRAWRRAQSDVSLVPTMGNLHLGHAALFKAAKCMGAPVLASIFVNPMQFNESRDLASYPRTPEQDGELLEGLGVDALFMPEYAEVYPNGFDTTIEMGAIASGLEGASRPGHFAGVATVVAKLLLMTQVQRIFLGNKDYQQVAVIRQLIRDLNMSVDVQTIDTVRDERGLALSSRNGRLTDKQMDLAPQLFAGLQYWAEVIRSNTHCDFSALEKQASEALSQQGFNCDYVAIRRQSDLQLPQQSDPLVILVAAWLGSVRLIDNLCV